MKKICRITLAALVLVLALLPMPALAIDPPDISNAINVVDVYGGSSGLITPGDQLYIITYLIDYTTNPTENIHSAFLARVVNGATDYGQVQPYSYFQDGYNQGVISIYLSTSAPAWGSPSTVRLEGNPALTWTGNIPLTTWTLASDNWTQGNSQVANKLNLASRIITIAGTLENFWEYDMVQSYSDGSSRLTDTGIAYFTNVIPNLYSMAPTIFPTGITTPEVATKAFTSSLAADTENRLAGTSIDNMFQQRPFGLPPLLGKALFLFTIVGIVGWGVTVATGESKPALFISIPVFLVGTWVGFGPWVFAALVTMFVMLGVAYVLFFRGAS